MSADDAVDWAGFGYSEIAFLMSQMEGSAVDTARAYFDFDDSVWSNDVLSAGLSSLFARALLMHRGEDALIPHEEAALLSAGINDAQLWARIVFLQEGGVVADSALMMHGEEITILLQPRNFGSWVMIVKSPETSDGRAVMALAEGFLEANPAGTVLVTAETESSERAARFARAGDVWSVDYPASDEGVASVSERHSAGSVSGAFESLLGSPSSRG